MFFELYHGREPAPAESRRIPSGSLSAAPFCKFLQKCLCG